MSHDTESHLERALTDPQRLATRDYRGHGFARPGSGAAEDSRTPASTHGPGRTSDRRRQQIDSSAGGFSPPGHLRSLSVLRDAERWHRVEWVWNCAEARRM